MGVSVEWSPSFHIKGKQRIRNSYILLVFTLLIRVPIYGKISYAIFFNLEFTKSMIQFLGLKEAKKC